MYSCRDGTTKVTCVARPVQLSLRTLSVKDLKSCLMLEAVNSDTDANKNIIGEVDEHRG